MNQTAGRHPATPSAIPCRGWRDVFIRCSRAFQPLPRWWPSTVCSPIRQPFRPTLIAPRACFRAGHYIGLGVATDLTVRVGRWLLLFLGVAFALAVLYRYGPSRSKPKLRWISWGSAFAAITRIIASVLFSWYTANFGTYDKTYGSLGAVIGFMVWLWISMIVILVGARPMPRWSVRRQYR